MPFFAGHWASEKVRQGGADKFETFSLEGQTNANPDDCLGWHEFREALIPRVADSQ